jgi:hypothetical protein
MFYEMVFTLFKGGYLRFYRCTAAAIAATSAVLCSCLQLSLQVGGCIFTEFVMYAGIMYKNRSAEELFVERREVWDLSSILPFHYLSEIVD